ncbi:MAG: glycosyltransferase family 4 protein [Myxococcales bacterium]|nr:glycosyltransferase family 4 protein [Myxococcales bacterium]
MNVLFVATRLAGTDGVSLEAAKMREVFEARGHRVSFCAGELDTAADGAADGHLVEAMHFRSEQNEALQRRAFPGLLEEGAAAVERDDGAGDDSQLMSDIDARASEIAEALGEIVDRTGADLIVVQNAWAIPMQLPLAVAIARVVEQRRLPVLSHNHDYWWERTRFAGTRVPTIVKGYFPYDGDRVSHVSINSEAKRSLERWRGIHSRVLPNVMDFEREPPALDDYSRDFRETIDVPPDKLLLLQPTRVVARKGIELAIDFAAALADLEPVLVITHEAGDEGLDTLHALEAKAARSGVDLRYVAEHVGDARRQRADGSKVYSLWDTYPHADVVTYPSLYEGFGNALLEAMWFRRTVLVNRYSVYVEDIAPKGFSLIEIDGEVTHDAIAQARALITDAARAEHAADHNYALCVEHFSYAALARVLDEALGDIGLSL